MLYWTDWSETNPGIYRSSVVSPAREALVTDNLIKPSALSIDFTGITSDYVGNLPTERSTDVLYFYLIKNLRIYSGEFLFQTMLNYVKQ